MTTRCRFAPSPTGAAHVGNLHTALFSWALARSQGGEFILRIEDTDARRNDANTIQPMLEALAWLGLDWDEGPDVGGDYGPYVQSDRRPRHQAVAAELVAAGHAYYGDDPDRPGQADAGLPLRLRLPEDGETVVEDALRGAVTFANRSLEDKIIVRADGQPLYHLAAMVDDHDMAISHVVRGEEFLASAPYHVWLYRAMGWTEPVWVHLPLIVNKRGEKLKKRDPEGGYLARDFQAAGYLPEALLNYLLLLGWASGDGQEIVGKADIRRRFSLDRLGKSPAIFDWDKLKWLNRRYLQGYSDQSLAALLRPFVEESYGPVENEAWLVSLTATVRESLATLDDVVAAAEWAFAGEVDYDAEAQAALRSETAGPALGQLVLAVAQVVILDAQTADSILRRLRQEGAERHAWSAAQTYHPIRAALTGSIGGPPLHQVMALLGQARCLDRLGAALRYRARRAGDG
jgi:glutamyl-tRNA synthetase